MSYAPSSALQAAVYAHLSTDAGLQALVGTHIYDAAPSGQTPPTYVSLGEETVQDRSDQTGAGALHLMDISVVTDEAGFQTAKEIAGAVSDLLVDADLPLTRGSLVYLRFERAVARRVKEAGARRIDLRFRARIDDNG